MLVVKIPFDSEKELWRRREEFRFECEEELCGAFGIWFWLGEHITRSQRCDEDAKDWTNKLGTVDFGIREDGAMFNLDAKRSFTIFRDHY
jgi:hypothetical protein